MNSNQNNNNNNTNISKPRYPIKFGILRDSKTAIYFDRIRENPRWITSVIKLNPFEEIGYNSNNNGLTYKIFPYNILLMPAGGPNWNYINTRLDRLAKLAHANRDKTFQAFLNNPYLPLYPKYCNAEVSRCQVMFSFAIPVLCPLLGCIHCSIQCYDCLFRPPGKLEEKEWNENLMRQHPELDGNFLDDQINTLFYELQDDLRRIHPNLHFDYNFQKFTGVNIGVDQFFLVVSDEATDSTLLHSYLNGATIMNFSTGQIIDLDRDLGLIGGLPNDVPQVRPSPAASSAPTLFTSNKVAPVEIYEKESGK